MVLTKELFCVRDLPGPHINVTLPVGFYLMDQTDDLGEITRIYTNPQESFLCETDALREATHVESD